MLEQNAEQEEDEKNKKFVRIATLRTRMVLRFLRRLRGCSNRSRYSFTDVQLQKIFSAIESELVKTKTAFGKKADDKPEISFSI